MIPFLPWLLYQGRKIKRIIPKLPDATGPEGSSLKINSSPLQFIGIGESTMAGVGVETHEQGLAGTFGRKLSSQTGRTVQWSVFAQS